MKQLIKQYNSSARQELENILKYWITNVTDKQGSGFIGRISGTGKKIDDSPRGSVLNTRILWTFSAAFNLTREKIYLESAERAFTYILKHFIDDNFGGVYWTVTALGKASDTKKQIYAQAFAVYALSEYFLASGNEEAKKSAIELYELINRYGYDEQSGGYFEAFARDWTSLSDIRLSEKDLNAPKSMNTHLHILEAYTTLFGIWPEERLKIKIQELIKIFLIHICRADKRHLDLFFESDWTKVGDMISYGHDIEASWLLQEAAALSGDDRLIKSVQSHSVSLALGALEGVDADGGMWHELDMQTRHLLKEKHWWPQAEAMVGFLNAWQITRDDRWLVHSLESWQFIHKQIKDNKAGEWFWGVDHRGRPMSEEDKVGIWKCPYHNARACIEVIERTQVFAAQY